MIALLAVIFLQTQTVPMTCDYDNLATDAGYTEAPCTMTVSEDGARETVRIGELIVVIEDLGGRQGRWSRVRLNGKPATGYELYRRSWVYATDDHSEFLDIRDRGAPKYPEE